MFYVNMKCNEAFSVKYSSCNVNGDKVFDFYFVHRGWQSRGNLNM